MNLKNAFSKIFSYTFSDDETFIIPDSPNNIESKEPLEKYVFPEYEKNLKIIKTKYNLLINSDINLREFEINISNKKFKAFLLFIDGMVDSNAINNSVLSPLLLKNTIKMSPNITSNKQTTKLAPKLSQNKKLSNTKNNLIKNSRKHL